MDAVVDIFDIGKRQIMLKPVGGIISGKFDLPGFDTLNNAHVQAIVAHDFHVLSDLVGRNHVRLFVDEKLRSMTSSSRPDAPASISIRGRGRSPRSVFARAEIVHPLRSSAIVFSHGFLAKCGKAKP
jgi:hypothetical protein